MKQRLFGGYAHGMSDGGINKTVIVGGGITGLATAFYLQQYSRDAIDYTLIESSPRWGGKVTSAHQQGFLIEGGPDSFLTQKGAALDLCRALDLADDLLPTNRNDGPTTYVWSGGRLHPMPDGMMLMAPTMILPLLRTRLISWPGKLRMGLEQFIPRRISDEDESLASFVRRRLGKEVLDKIAGPLMGGIHAADPERLSIRSAFPMFPDMEKNHGSLFRGVVERMRSQPRARPGTGRTSMFMSLRGGLQQLIDSLVARLHPAALRLNCRPSAINAEASRYRIALSDGSSLLADNLVLATPAYVSADLLQALDEVCASRLRAIRYVSTATVSLGFRRSDVAHPMIGFGFVVPYSEGRSITACSWSSNKFAERAPDDCVLLRVFVGGAQAEGLAEQDDAALVGLARKELQIIMGITAAPVVTKVYRWHKANPQQELGHGERVAAIEQAVRSHPGLYLAGAGFHGAGIPDCIQSGMRTALELTKRLSCDEQAGTARDLAVTG